MVLQRHILKQQAPVPVFSEFGNENRYYEKGEIFLN
jgi:hypothetical protein